MMANGGERERLLSKTSDYGSNDEVNVTLDGARDAGKKVTQSDHVLTERTSREARLHWRRVITTALLMLLNVATLWDRAVVSALFPHIQAYFGVSDSSSGSIEAFSAPINAVCLLLYGLFDGRYQRKRLLLGSMATWSAVALGASVVSNDQFWLFCAFRACSSIGTAALVTLLLPIIGDYYQGSRRTLVVMIFSITSVVGSPLSMSGSTLLVEHGFDWQSLLRMAPPLTASALLLLLFVMPAEKSAGRSALSQSGIFKGIVRLWTVRSYVRVLLAQCILSPVMAGEMFWGSTSLLRAMEYRNYAPDVFHGLSYAAILTVYSSLGAAGSFVGVTAGSAILDAWQRGRGCFRWIGGATRAVPLTLTISSAMTSCLFSAAVIAQSREIFALFVVTTILTAFSGAAVPIYSHLILDTVPPAQHALAFAVQSLLLTLINAPAPSIVGAVSDALRGGREDNSSRYLSLFWALIGTSVVSTILAPLAFASVIRFYPRDLAAAAAAKAKEELQNSPPEK